MHRRSVAFVIAAACAVLHFLPTDGTHSGGVFAAGVRAASAPTDLWNLDRVNQAALPLDSNTAFGDLTGAGVDIYVVDSGIRATHEQLTGRVLAGFDVLTDTGMSPVSPRGSDCDGHGTHVASLAAGATVGVARGARVIAVRVLDCNGNGEIYDVVAGLEWIRAHHQSGRAAIANLSLGVDIGDDGTQIIEMLNELEAEGIVVVTAAGNGDSAGNGIDACRVAPGSDPGSFNVGALTKADAPTYYSNYGACVDIWAPGGDRTNGVNGAWYRSDVDYLGDIGTSMAAPLVAGAIALLAGRQPTLCPEQYTDALIERSTKNAITGLKGDSPNRLLFVDTAPVTSLRPPGKPSNIIITPDSSSLLVGWDPPCDGGSAVTSYTVSVLFGGKVVKRVKVDAAKTAVRVRGLQPGRGYAVVVKPTNAIGPGVATRRIPAPRVLSLRKGTALSLDWLVHTDSDTDVKVTSLTPKVCRVRPTRIIGLSTGTCRYTVVPNGAETGVTRTIRVAP